MTGSLSDWATSIEFRNIIKGIVEDTLQKKRPDPRIAEVTGIDRTTRTLAVRFIGETEDVQVPYTSVAPANIGQFVRIGGTTHDRHVEDVVGQTELEVRSTITEGRVKAILDTVTPDWEDTAVDDLPEKTGSYFTGVEDKIESNKSEAELNFVVIRSTRPLYEGVDPTGEATFDYQLLTPMPQSQTASGGSSDSAAHTHGIPMQTPVIGMGQNTGLIGFIRCNLASTKQLASWMAYRSGTVSEFYFDIYKMDQSQGNVSKVLTSSNMAADLNTSLSWMTRLFEPFDTQPGDIYAVQFRLVGSGSVMLAGIQLPAPLPPAGFRPAQIGAVRTGVASNPNPAIISTTELDSAYSGSTIYFQLGSSIGNVSIPRKIYDPFDALPFNANWRSRSTGGYMSISNGAAVHAGPDGYTAMMYAAAMTTDQFKIKAPMNVASSTAFQALLIGTIGLDGTYLEAQFFNNKCRLTTVSSFGNSATVRAERAYTQRSSITPVVRYVQATKTYEIYVNESDVDPWVTWTDSANIVPKNSAYRYVGFGILQGYFDGSGSMDSFSAEDY